MKVAILGTGMAGYVAAHAVRCHDKDAKITLYGVNQFPIPSGARWFERAIPNLDTVNRMCKVESSGSADEYGSKVGGPISTYYRARPDFLAFNYWQAYADLWHIYNGDVIQLEANRELITTSSWDDCDFVFNSGPRPNFYDRSDHHLFAATRHWRLDEGDDGARNPYTLPGKNAEKHLMIYDGSENSSWYRITQLFGLMSVEWGYHHRPPIAGTYLEILPLAVPPEVGLRQIVPGWQGTTALAHVGAMAQWVPSTDVGEVFNQVTNVLLTGQHMTKGEDNDDDSRGRDS